MRVELKNKLQNSPEKPGCYFWKDVKGNIIYVGKAKNIKKRLSQYFNNTHNNRIAKLVNEIYDVDYIIVNNENEALVLENNLIKTNKPKYNVLLKENSNYPYIILTNEDQPRLVYTRKYNSYKGKVFGPFPSSETNAYEVYNLIQRIVPLRKCKHIPNKKCIYYDLGQCLAPCINSISKEKNKELKNQVIDIFNNKTKKIIYLLKEKEINSSNNLDFENAKYYLELQNSLKQLNKKQIVEFVNNSDIDIIGYYANQEYISIIIFNFINGKLIAKNSHLSKYYDDDINDAIISYLIQYYSTNKAPKEIYLNIDKNSLVELNNYLGFNVQNTNKSKYNKLILLAIQNAKKYLLDYKLKIDYEYERTIGAFDELSNLLKVDKITRIDMVDNSNIFNSNPVSAFVTFINGVKNTKYYRKINLDNLKEKSDFHYMIYAIEKRYKNIINEIDKPDFLIVDGGKIQISAAIKAFNHLNIKDIEVIGLVKNKKHKTESILKSDGTEIKLDKNTPLYNMLSNIQEEVHRFAISHFREKRSKSQMSIFLDGIKGLGPKTKEKILEIYPNIYSIKNIDENTLSQIINKKIAREIIKKIKEI